MLEFWFKLLILDGDQHPVQTVAHLMKLSFDEGHRQAICQLGGIHTISLLVEVCTNFVIIPPLTLSPTNMAGWHCEFLRSI